MWRFVGKKTKHDVMIFKWNRPELAELVWPHLAAPFSSTFDCTYCMNQTGLILFGLMLKSFLLFKSFELPVF